MLRRELLGLHVEQRQFGTCGLERSGLRDVRPHERPTGQLLSDEKFQHPAVALTRGFDLRELLLDGQQFDFDGIGIALHRRTVALQRTHLVEVAPQQSERQFRLRDPFVEQQNAEIEVVHPPLQRIEIDIRRLPLFGGFGFGDAFVGSRLSAVPNRLGHFQLHFILVLIHPRHPYAVLGKHTGQRIGERGHGGLPRGLRRKRQLRQPLPPCIRKRVLLRLPHQVVAPDFGVMVPRQQTARVERQLGAGRTPDQQTPAQ